MDIVILVTGVRHFIISLRLRQIVLSMSCKFFTYSRNSFLVVWKIFCCKTWTYLLKNKNNNSCFPATDVLLATLFKAWMKVCLKLINAGNCLVHVEWVFWIYAEIMPAKKWPISAGATVYFGPFFIYCSPLFHPYTSYISCTRLNKARISEL